jgi:elongation factor P
MRLSPTGEDFRRAAPQTMGITAKNLRPGNKIVYDNEAWTVMEFKHRTPGKGQAVVQIRMRNLIDGRTSEARFGSTDTVAEADTETRKMQYLYKNEDGFNFMDLETYEQLAIPTDNMGDSAYYLLDNAEVIVQFLDGKPIGVDLPASVELEVVQTEPGVKGDTVNNVTKPATLSTGLVVQVPIFINQGEMIKVDTRTGDYLGRAK